MKAKRIGTIIILMIGFALFDIFNIQTVNASKMTTMYVIDQKKVNGVGEKYKYYKNGLIKKSSYKSGSYTKIKYKKKEVVKVVKGSSEKIYFIEKWKYKKKKLIKKEIAHFTEYTPKSGDITYEKYYYNKKGDLVERIITNNITSDETLLYYYNKNGQLIEKVYNGDVYKYQYDKKGNISSLDDSLMGNHKYKLKYKKGKLVKQIITNMPDTPNNQVVYKFKYKKMRVKKSYVKLIKKQQWEIINGSSI